MSVASVRASCQFEKLLEEINYVIFLNFSFIYIFYIIFLNKIQNLQLIKKYIYLNINKISGQKNKIITINILNLNIYIYIK